MADVPRRRGGARQGQPGVDYPNRTDLQTGPRAQPIRVATGQPYGEAGRQRAAQQAVPLPQEPRVRPGAGLAAAIASPALGHGLIPLDAPSQRPDEPITAGLSTGPGPGPEVLGLATGPDTVADQLRAIYQAYPNEDLRYAIEELERS